MNKTTVFGCVAAIAMFASAAYAANWVRVVNNYHLSDQPKCAMNIDIDTSTWTYDGDVVQAWDRTTYGPSHSTCPNIKFQEAKVLSIYDCRTKKLHLTYGHSTDWNGQVKGTKIDDDNDWIVVVPDTTGDAILNFVCAHNPNFVK